MRNKILSWKRLGISAILIAGCATPPRPRNISEGVLYPFRLFDVNAVALSERLTAHEAQRPLTILQREGYLHRFGSLIDIPIQQFTTTNFVYVPQKKTLSGVKLTYTPPQETVNDDAPYIILRVFREEKQSDGSKTYTWETQIDPAGFSMRRDFGGTTYSYEFYCEPLAPQAYYLRTGRYRYEWWNTIPPTSLEQTVQGMTSTFFPLMGFFLFDEVPLLEGFFEVK